MKIVKETEKKSVPNLFSNLPQPKTKFVNRKQKNILKDENR
jgi:hypothetical protein